MKKSYNWKSNSFRLFDSEEVEGYTYTKYSRIKLAILGGVLFVAFVGIGWMMSMLTQLVSVMDLMV